MAHIGNGLLLSRFPGSIQLLDTRAVFFSYRSSICHLPPQAALTRRYMVYYSAAA
jgi:hypothetical protein